MGHATVGKQSYHPGQRVTAVVKKRLPFGIFVRLPDGSKGYIRRRQLSWCGDIDPRKLVQDGETIAAIVLDSATQSPGLELSHRDTLPSPWPLFVQSYQTGALVKGTVKDLQPYGIHVQIIPGVDGFVPLAELAPWAVAQPESLVWVGDSVEAIITRINPQEKKVWLSMRRRLQQMAVANSIMDCFQPESDVPEEEGDEEDVPPEAEMSHALSLTLALSPDGANLGKILVVEDQDDLRTSLVTWLQERGYTASGAGTVVEAEQLLQDEPVAVCFVDIDLPGADGLSLIRFIRDKQLTTCPIVMSISEWLTERAAEIQQLGVAAVLLKPLDLNELEDLLHQISRGETPSLHWEPETPWAPVEAQSAFQKVARIMRSRRPLLERLESGLAGLVAQTGADAAIIFHLDPASHSISIIAQQGELFLDHQAQYALENSPVKDVIQEGIPIFAGHISAASTGKFRKLQEHLAFESCIGMPIGLLGETNHALFLFDQNRCAFTQYSLRDVQAAATLFAAALESHTLDERIQADSGIFLSGQLAAGFGHEVNNKISALEIQLRNLQASTNKLLLQSPRLLETNTGADLLQIHSSIFQTALDLKRTVQLFHNLTRTPGQHKTNVSRVMHVAKTQLQPLMGKHNVKVALMLDANLPDVPVQEIHLQQVFLNIMLNAIQQMSGQTYGDKELRIKTSYLPEVDDLPIQIRFYDSGPGIHKQIWSKIFSLGFSTRTEGSGLGLFIAHSLIENMGGRISVEESVISLGSTFLIELPVLDGRMLYGYGAAVPGLAC